MLSRIRAKRGLRNAYVLVDDRRHEAEFYAFSSWSKMTKKAAELIMNEIEEYPEKLQQEIKDHFQKDKYEEVLYAWREAYGQRNGISLRREVLKIDEEERLQRDMA